MGSLPYGFSRDEQMAKERFSLAFAGPLMRADSPVTAGRAGIQALIKTLQEIGGDLGVKQRHVLVLTALASFAREFTADNRPIVFSSNAALSRRSCGMPISTLQRTLRELCNLGLIDRHMSPNGKRYTHRDSDGNIVEAFGIDLGPLLARGAEFDELLRFQQERKGRIRLLRDKISLLRHAFPECAPEQAIIRAVLSRKRGCEANLVAILKTLEDAAYAATISTSGSEPADEPGRMLEQQHEPTRDEHGTADPSTGNQVAVCALTPTGRQVDTHYQSSNTKNFESEENDERQDSPRAAQTKGPISRISPVEVNEVCQEATQYAEVKPKTWHDLIALALRLAPMVGIAEGLARRAIASLGAEGFALTILCIVQKFSEIRSPAAYLTRLLEPRGRAYSPSRFFRSLRHPRHALSMPQA